MEDLLARCFLARFTKYTFLTNLENKMLENIQKLRYKDKVVIVTGATSGIGEGIALKFGEFGIFSGLDS